MHPKLLTACIGLSLASMIAGTKAGTFTNDFNLSTNAPAGTTLKGTAFIDTTGGVDNSGVLKLTLAVNGQAASFVIDDLDAGAPVSMCPC